MPQLGYPKQNRMVTLQRVTNAKSFRQLNTLVIWALERCSKLPHLQSLHRRVTVLGGRKRGQIQYTAFFSVFVPALNPHSLWCVAHQYAPEACHLLTPDDVQKKKARFGPLRYVIAERYIPQHIKFSLLLCLTCSVS